MLHEMISDQNEFDGLLTLLDRELFYLKDKISIEAFRSKLLEKNYTEHSDQLHFKYEINWKSLFPKKWLDINQTVSLHLEEHVKCTSRFINNTLCFQTLTFLDGISAESFFELFRGNSNWKHDSNDKILLKAESADKLHKITYTVTEDEFNGELSHKIMLIYK